MMRPEIEKMNACQKADEIARLHIQQANLVLLKFSYGAQQQRVGKIMIRICKAMKVSPQEVMSRRRNRQIVAARQAVMYWAIRLTRLSMPQVGKILDDRDHTTVLHGVRIHRERREKQGRYLRQAR